MDIQKDDKLSVLAEEHRPKAWAFRTMCSGEIWRPTPASYIAQKQQF
jgi:hypothetical protein